MKRTQVTCPDCGAVGANDGPCKCCKCDYKVLMLPSNNGTIKGNWLEHCRMTNQELPKHPRLENYI